MRRVLRLFGLIVVLSFGSAGIAASQEDAATTGADVEEADDDDGAGNLGLAGLLGLLGLAGLKRRDREGVNVVDRDRETARNR